ncbi:MAG: ATP phosphoribosyltransferase [Acidobacteriota bacterium]
METNLTLALPKGRIMEQTLALLADAGLRIQSNGRSYRPWVSDPTVEAKYLKPQNIPRLIELGAHDCGFTGYDWLVETGAEVIEVLDTGLDPVTLVAAAPEGLGARLGSLGRPVVVASEFEALATRFVTARGWPFVFIRTFGATEVFPPEDADLVLDLTATGTTLRENRLEIVADVLSSSTRFVASTRAFDDPGKRGRIEALGMLLRAVLDARTRVLVEVNVPTDRLDAVVALLPAMKSPTIQPLFGGQGFAVKAAVLRSQLPRVITDLRAVGASDLIAYALEQVIP